MSLALSDLFYLRQVNLAIQKILDDRLRSAGILSKDVTGAAAVVLILAAEHGEISAAALARLQGITPQAVSRNVAALTQRGLIKRLGSDDSQRILLIRLTPAGERVRLSVLKVFAEVEDEVFRGVKAKDREVMRRALRTALRNVRPFALTGGALQTASVPETVSGDEVVEEA